jgi:putative transposase
VSEATRRLHRTGRPAAGAAARSRVGDRLPVRPDRRRAQPQAAARVDEFTREALAIECHRRIDADKTVSVLDRLVLERGTAPGFLRCDNGPEMTANAIRDWCRFSRAGSAYIEPGSPWQNAYVESFGGRVRDELLAVQLFSCLTEARMLIEDWRQDYNNRRPHSA